jgi:hypothetical protein
MPANDLCRSFRQANSWALWTWNVPGAGYAVEVPEGLHFRVKQGSARLESRLMAGCWRTSAVVYILLYTICTFLSRGKSGPRQKFFTGGVARGLIGVRVQGPKFKVFDSNCAAGHGFSPGFHTLCSEPDPCSARRVLLVVHRGAVRGAKCAALSSGRGPLGDSPGHSPRAATSKIVANLCPMQVSDRNSSISFGSTEVRHAQISRGRADGSSSLLRDSRVRQIDILPRTIL